MPSWSIATVGSLHGSIPIKNELDSHIFSSFNLQSGGISPDSTHTGKE